MIYSCCDRKATLHREKKIFSETPAETHSPSPLPALSLSLITIVKGSEIVLCFPLSRYRHLLLEGSNWLAG